MYACLLKYYLAKFQLALENIPSDSAQLKYEEFYYFDFLMR